MRVLQHGISPAHLALVPFASFTDSASLSACLLVTPESLLERGSLVEHIYHGRQEDEMEEQIGALFQPLKTQPPTQ